MSEVANQMIDIAGRTPEAIFNPQSLDELRDLVRKQERLTFVPRGGATQLDLGCVPSGPFAIVDVTAALGGEVEHALEDLTVVVPAGVTLSEINRVLQSHGAGPQMLPIDPPLADRSTVGGALGVGVGGPLRGRYGLPRDLVLGVTVLRADGELVHAGGRVVKNVTGYDLMRTWCGSLGTLGILTSVSLRVLPKPTARDFKVTISGLDEGQRLVDLLLRADVRPEIADIIGEQGDWRLLLRFTEASVAPAARVLSGHAFDETATEEYLLARDAGFREGDALSVRVAALPTDLGEVGARLGKLGPAVLVARPNGGFVRAAWDDSRVPASENLAQTLADLRQHLRGSGGSGRR